MFSQGKFLQKFTCFFSGKKEESSGISVDLFALE
jgi:hypothetical protein